MQRDEDLAAATDRNQALEEPQLTQLASDHAPDSIFWIDEQAHIRYANASACLTLGHAQAELLNMSIFDIDPEFPPDSWQELKQRGHIHFETRHRHKDGSLIPVDVKMTCISYGKKKYHCAFVRDISEQKRNQLLLQAERKRFMTLFDSSNDAIFILNMQGGFIDMNRTAYERLGYSRDEMLGMSVSELDPPEFAAKVPERMAQIMRHGVAVFESAHYRKDGSIMPVEINARIIELDQDQVVFSNIRDISERKQAEETIKQREIQFHSIIDASPVPYALNDDALNIIYLNPAFIRTFGYNLKDIPKLEDWWSKAYPDKEYREWVKSTWQQHLRKAKKDNTPFDAIELIIHCKNGEVRTVMVGAAPLGESFEKMHLVTLYDITEHKRLEEQLRQSQKMESIGTLVGGIAHDFNNILAAMQGNLYLVKRQKQHTQLTTDKLSNIEQLGNRAATMIQQLLTFARKDTVSMRTFSLNTFMREGYKLVTTAIPENVDHQTSVCIEELHIRGDETQLQQVLMNLLNNAVDAVAKTQEPRIRCNLNPIEAGHTLRQAHPEMTNKRYACITISDNGHGIPATEMDKIFEPFFTTKEVGKGSGLGLSMTYGAIHSHGGIVEVESEQGTGTVFRIYLPLCTDEPETAAPIPESDIQGHGETILLVDDEESIRSTTSEVLTSMGYRVIVACNGKEALDLFRGQREQIDLIISDVIMPILGGIDLLKSVRQSNTSLPFILVTGYDLDHVMDSAMQHKNYHLLHKPFNFEILSESIQTLIGAVKPDHPPHSL